MKEIKYEMQTLSSLILSPRSGQALYKDVDEFEQHLRCRITKEKR